MSSLTSSPAAVAAVLVVHGAIAAGDGFHLIHEIHEDFVERKLGREHDPACVEGLGVLDFAPFVHDELHQRRDELIRDHDVAHHDRLADFLDHAEIGKLFGVIHLEDFAIRPEHLVNDRRVGGDDVHVELAAETFENDLHVEKAKEAAAEAKSERHA